MWKGRWRGGGRVEGLWRAGGGGSGGVEGQNLFKIT